MDAGLAAILGAIVVGIFSLAGPWIRSSVERKTARNETLWNGRRQAIADVIEALAGLHIARLQERSWGAEHTAAAIAITRLALLLDSKNSSIEMASTMTLTIMMVDPPDRRAATMGAFQRAIHEWYRGDVSGSQFTERFRTLTRENVEMASGRDEGE